MTDIPGRVGRAFRDHAAFEQVDERNYTMVTTPFDGQVTVGAADGGRIAFDVSVRVPMLSATVEDVVAPVVEEGWYETFELRVADAGGVTAASHDLEPTVRQADDEAVVETAFEDVNERRGVDDAGAVINYVEGTYVQGIIPGYDYVDPVASLLNRAKEQAGTGF